MKVENWATESMSTSSHRLSMDGVSKRFGSTVALADVSLDVRAGEVHAIVGENGAGKSTLMKILSGAVQADAGAMRLNGESYRPSGPHQARQRGVAMIYQELALALHLSVEANVMLGLEEHRFGFLQRKSHRARVLNALALLDHPEIQPATPVHRLSPGARQLVEVARALVSDAQIIIFDEPTSSLTHHDAEHLFSLIERLKLRGVSVLYISHFLEEVERVADRYTVLRDGRPAGAGVTANTTREQIIRQMVGRELKDLYPRRPRTIGEPVLTARQVCGGPLPTDVDLTLHRCEVLGLFGLVGAGRTELLRILFGLDAPTSGIVTLRGRDVTHRPPSQRIGLGMGLLSEDRKLEGLALNRSLADNVTLSWLRPYLRGPFLNLGKRRSSVEDRLNQVNVRRRHAEQRALELSGGNQQKVVLARLLHQESDVLLLDEPTRGVDVASKAEIYRLIDTVAARGAAVLLVSSYLPELMGVCDTLAVMARGRLSEARPVRAWTEEHIMSVATGESSPAF